MIKDRKELIKKYIEFFKKQGHKEIPNYSLVPQNDPTVLFTTAGMHPLVPYLLGQKHPLGKRLCNVQKCIRTGDIDEVGDDSHLTFFEMLGNWSLGDYFKKEAIEMSYEFLTKTIKIPEQEITVTCFKGDKDAPKDQEAAKIWKSLGIKKIKFLGKEDNWWGPAGEIGPCGPDTEMFVQSQEIWNDVFMQYNKTKSGKYLPLKQKNVDTGMGVERTLAILNNMKSVYETSTFQPIIKQIEKLSGEKHGKNLKQTKHIRIIADHIKAACFIINDGVTPSNVERGYVLRRLIRRAIRYGHVIGLKHFVKKVAESVLPIYPDYKLNKQLIFSELEKEEERFERVLEEGLKIAKKILKHKIPITAEQARKLRGEAKEKTVEIMGNVLERKRKGKAYGIKKADLSEKNIDKALITGKEAFDLYQSFGFPRDMILDLAIEKRFLVDLEGFDKEYAKHQKLSRKATKGVFKSGLADSSEITKRLHTATHLLNQALREVISKDIKQKGSNITAERLRFDFNFDRKLTDQEKKKIEDWVNDKINKALLVTKEEMPLDKALDSGAQAEFGAKYPNRVTVFTITDGKKELSKEICTGPHVANTSELGKFKIIKEESSAAGIRRIKAVLE